ncbi:mechanosensitive ion channel [Niabella insulamsoli]|uniref:mechanosensitive ion channel n=1 Tax=Niabella insulamsoli TaxID=3144874 RepID=UPI0031FD187B
MLNLFSKFSLQQNVPADDYFNGASSTVANQFYDLGKWLGLTGPALHIVGGLLLLIIGYIIAKFVGRLVKNILAKAGVDRKTEAGFSLSKFAGKLVYYLLMIIVLMATLSLMGVSGDVLAPLNQMTAKFFGAIPNILAAGIIAYVGYFLAKIVADLISASGDKIRALLPSISNIKDKNEFDTNVTEISKDLKQVDTRGFDIVNILKNIAFIVVFVPILIIALEKLNMQVITDPATNMLDTFINAIPSIAYASIILLAAAIGGRFISSLLGDLLRSFQVNTLVHKLKLDNVLGKFDLVKVITNLAYAFIIYVGIVEASKQLGLMEVVDILDKVLAVAGKIVFGLLILALGNFVANFATNLFLNNKQANKFTAAIVRGAIIVIFLAMGLHAMGIANNIIELAFGLSLGAIAVAFALSFGLGGREAAGEEVKSFFSRLKNKDQ